jgi:Zn-dependent protease
VYLHCLICGRLVTGMGYSFNMEPPQKIRFSRKELQDLLIATLVISVAFAIALSSYAGITSIDWAAFPLSLLISILAIGSGFILHEMGHKALAIRYGAWAEFRAWWMGLLMALMMALLVGVVFAAPGAVYIAGNITEEQNGKISAMGPLVNLTFAVIFFPLVFLTTGVFTTICFYIYYINAFLGVFNLIPLGPLDGAKVLRWNVAIFIALFGAAIALLVPAFIYF